MKAFTVNATSRRQIIRLGALAILGPLAVACSQATAPATQPTTAPAAQPTAAQSSAAQPTAAAVSAAKPTAAPAAAASTTKASLEVIDSAADPAEKKAWEDQFQTFSQKNPNITIKYTPVASDFLSKLNTMIAGGTTPDMVYIGNGDILHYAVEGAFLPLSPLMARDKFSTAGLYPKIVAEYNVQGVQYALPGDAPTQQLYINLTEYQNSKTDLPSFSWTDKTWNWDAFLKAAQNMTVRDKSGNTTKYGYQVKTDFRSWWVWVAANGGQMFDETGTKCLLDQPAAVEAFQFLSDLIHKHKVAPTVDAAQAMGGGNMFMGGNLAMATFPPWLTLMRQDVKGWQWDVCPPPAGKAGKACAGGGTGIAVGKVTKFPDQTWEYIKWRSSPEGASLWAKDAGIVSPVESVDKTDAFLQPGKPPEHIQVFLEGLNHLSADPKNLKFGEVVTVIGQELSYVWNGTRPAQDVLTEAVKKANVVLQQK